MPFILGFLMFSIIFSYLVFKYVGPPFSKIIQGLTMVGVIIHELCHLVMCIITRSPIEHVTLIKKLDYQEGQKFGYYGEVQAQAERISFLQAVLIGLAPLYISFWIFFFLLEMLTTVQVHVVVFTISVLVMISISLSAAPSLPDLSVIPKAFLNDTNYSIYQIFLLVISVLTTITMLTAFNKLGIHGIYVYLIITGFYFGFKYGFLLFNILFNKLNFFGKNPYNRRYYKKYTRRSNRHEKRRLYYNYRD